jgi:hypothetical protein
MINMLYVSRHVRVLLITIVLQAIYTAWNELSALSDARAAALETARQTQERLDELRVNYAKQAAVCPVLHIQRLRYHVSL